MYIEKQTFMGNYLTKKLKNMKKSKRIELTENTIKYFAKKAIDEGTSFKPYVESVLESLANTQVERKKEKQMDTNVGLSL